MLLLFTRHYPEAEHAYDRALQLVPANLAMRDERAMVALAQGDLSAAQAVLRAAPHEVDPTALVAYVANNWDLDWVLDEAQQRLLFRLTPSAFDDSRAIWGVVLAQTYALQGNGARARVYADSSRLAFQQQLQATPQDGQSHAFLGLALAYLGQKAAAIREGERGVALLPISRNAIARAVLPAPARPHLHPRRRARKGARPTRAAAQNAVLPLARLAQDRPQLRTAAG